MKPVLRPDGALEVPARVAGPGDALGDTVVVLHPGDPEYARWLDYLERTAPGR